jgi:hypothetical protein
MPQPSPNPNALLTSKHQLIEEEHARLDRCLCDLCDLCPSCSKFNSLADSHTCSKEQTAACQGRLTSFFYEFQFLVFEHFDNVEIIIGDALQSADKEYYLHLQQKEHDHLMLEIKHQIQESAALSQQGNVREAIRHFYQLITARLKEHVCFYDNILLINSQG